MTVVNDVAVTWVKNRWRTDVPAEGGPSFAVLGVPFDYAVSHRPGARFGPRAITEALRGYSLYCTDKRVSLDDVWFVDSGEVDVVHSFHETYARIADAVRSLPAGLHPIVLGGDHSVTDPSFRGLSARAGGARFGLVVFDAHFDSRPPVPGKEHSGHWMHTLGDIVEYGAAVQLGINAPIYSAAYMAEAEARGVLVRTPYEIRRAGWAATIEEAVTHSSRGTDGVYVSVDIDCLDQAVAPGTSVPNPTGLAAHEVVDAVFEVAARADVVALDITEVSPPLDPSGRTAEVAAHIVLNYVAGVVHRAGRAG